MPSIFLKEKTSLNVRSIQYGSLVAELEQHPKGFVGIEIPSGGSPQHYFYQAIGSEIQRYPLRKLGGTYSCMRGYSCLLKNQEDNEAYFGAPKAVEQALPPPALPEGSLFFTADDSLAIQKIIEAERSDKLKVTEDVPYFPDLALTKAQQEYLYQEPVLKGKDIFQEELSKILNDKELSLDEKEAILKACISKERIPLGELEIRARTLQTSFLTLDGIIRFPVETLSAKALTEGRETPPSLGAIQMFYVRCIQSHLQKPIEKEALKVFAPMSALIPLGQIPATEQIETYKGLSDREETCFNALNVLLMSGTEQARLQNIIESNPKFMDVADDIFEMLSDLKDAVDNKKQTTSKPKYEMIYREFFITHEIDLASLGHLKSLNPAYWALQELKLFIELDKLEKQCIQLNTASPEESEVLKRLLQEKQNDPEPLIQKKATELLQRYKHIELDKLDKRCAQLNTASSEETDVVKRLLQEKQSDPTPHIRKKTIELLLQHQLLNKDEKKALLLESVVKCRMETVDLLLLEDQSLLLHHGNVTDYSGREWQNITAVQYANWAEDAEMFETLVKYIHSIDIKEEEDKVRAQVKHQIDEADKHGIVYKFNGQEVKESRYNHKELSDAYKAYIEQSDWNEVNRSWLLIGAAQRNIPVHVAHHYCHHDKHTQPLDIYNYISKRREQWFPLASGDGVVLGRDFSIAMCHDNADGWKATGGSSLISRRVSLDWRILFDLFSENTRQLKFLKEYFLNPKQESGLAASCGF